MNQFVIFMLLLLVLFVTMVAIGGYYWYRRISRRAKDIERSLKMVPLLVKLPPQEVEEGSRDMREVIKENIARAEGVFNLLSGVATEKSTFYGKKHISFEIVAEGKLINFYIAVPASLLSAVQKSLTSGYPDIQIEKAEDTNIFSRKSKIAGVQGGELVLTKESYLPINTYKESDSDAMTGMLAGLSNLADTEGAAIQVMVRPADSKWAKKAISNAKSILNPNKKASGTTNKVLDLLVELLQAPFRTKSEGDNGKSEPKQIDAIDQKKADMIELKAKSPVFETLIRLVASSEDTLRTKVIIQDLTLGFAQLSQGGANSFKYKSADQPQDVATDFIFRFFPAKKNNMKTH